VISTLAAGVVAPDRRALVAGTLLSGSIGGILLARTFGGVLGEQLGWRAPYLVAAAVSAALAALLARTLPATAPRSRQPYPALVVEPLRLLAREPVLRRSAFYQATTFAGFTAAWIGIARLLSGPVYGLGAEAVGLLALVGVVTMVATPLAGRVVDRDGPDRVNTIALAASVAVCPAAGRGVAGRVPRARRAGARDAAARRRDAVRDGRERRAVLCGPARGAQSMRSGPRRTIG
jgi:predicted MFS family arabinose efflux permease